jgi:hypothetical protein
MRMKFVDSAGVCCSCLRALTRGRSLYSVEVPSQPPGRSDPGSEPRCRGTCAGDSNTMSVLWVLCPAGLSAAIKAEHCGLVTETPVCDLGRWKSGLRSLGKFAVLTQLGGPPVEMYTCCLVTAGSNLLRYACAWVIGWLVRRRTAACCSRS